MWHRRKPSSGIWWSQYHCEPCQYFRVCAIQRLLRIIQMLQVYERAYVLCVVTYKIFQILQSWDKLLSSSTSTEIHRDRGITARSSGKWFCPMSNKNAALCLQQSAVNLNKLSLVEIELFIKMLYGAWSSLQPDHETNKSLCRMLQPGTMTGRRSETVEDLLYLFSSEDKYKGFSRIKGKIDRSIGINYSSVNFKWTQVFLCCQSFDRRGQWIF